MKQTETTELERRIVKRFQRALTEFRLIDDGDKVLVGLSGGKDSLCLLELLAKRQRILRPHFTVEAIHIRMENIKYESDTSYLQQFCNNLGVKLHLATTSFEQRNEKPVCFLCSWNRRKLMFNLAQAEGFNKIALGHHQDDILHTALMNQLFQGHFSTMPVKLKMKKMPLTIIRPLCMEHETDMAAYALQQGYKKQLKLCPNERDTNRTFARKLFEEAEAVNGEVRYSLWNALKSEGKLIEY